MGICEIAGDRPSVTITPPATPAVPETTTTMRPTTTTLTPVAQQQYGCYKDSRSRDLPSDFMHFSDNTPAKCIAHCRSKGHKYAGVQYSHQCFCGNSFNNYGESKQCKMPCPGDKSLKCGGPWANNV